MERKHQWWLETLFTTTIAGDLKLLEVLQCIKLSMVHVFIWGKITFKCLTPLSKEAQNFYLTRIKTIADFYYRYVR